MLDAKEEIEDITEAADKQKKIEEQLKDISEYWATEAFEFGQWRGREVNCVLGGGKVQEIQESMEDSFAKLNTMNAMRHVTPFKDIVQDKLVIFSDVSDTIEKWIKV